MSERLAVVNPRSCGTCLWWDDDGNCRRFPPRWPSTQIDDWCGEWALAKEAGEIEAMMRAVAIMEGNEPFETYTDKGRRALKQAAVIWLSAMRQCGLIPIIAGDRDA